MSLITLNISNFHAWFIRNFIHIFIYILQNSLPFFSKLNLAYNHLNDRVRKGQLYEDAWNNTSVELVEIAELHGRTIIVETFYNTVKDLERSTSKELWTVLQQLLQLYAVHTALRCSGHLLRVCILFEWCIKRVMLIFLCFVKNLRNSNII